MDYDRILRTCYDKKLSQFEVKWLKKEHRLKDIINRYIPSTSLELNGIKSAPSLIIAVGDLYDSFHSLLADIQTIRLTNYTKIMSNDDETVISIIIYSGDNSKKVYVDCHILPNPGLIPSMCYGMARFVSADVRDVYGNAEYENVYI